MAGRKDVFQNAMNRGHSAAWDQEWDRAANYYEQALQEFPENSQALTSLALAFYQTQQYEKALNFYLRAAQIASNDPVPRKKPRKFMSALVPLNARAKPPLLPQNYTLAQKT